MLLKKSKCCPESTHFTQSLTMMGRTLRARNKASDGFATNDGQIALRKCLLFMDSFRALRRVMPLQEAYAFLLVASEEGRGVSEYAKCAG